MDKTILLTEVDSSTLVRSFMYCPNCGTAGQTAKAYCKNCGEWLPHFKAKNRNTFGGETPQQMISTSLFMSAASALAALLSALALYLTYLPSGDAKWSVYLAGAFCLCIAGWQASSFFITLRLRRRLKHSREAESIPAGLRQSQSAPALNAGDFSNLVGVASVTENSTELLDHVGSRSRNTQRK